MTLLPEWEPCDAIILAWPHEHTDWAPWLESVRDTYGQLVNAINEAGAGVILLHRAQDKEALVECLDGSANVLLIEAEYNDTWARDYAFLTCADGSNRIPVEFTFNGWGNKFDARLDNQVNRRYLAKLCQHPIVTLPFVCEGGALEIDATGHLLSTALCLSNPERNQDFSLARYKTLFGDHLGAKHVTIFEHGHLEGDDTDGHIDTLVRFTPDSGLVIQGAQNRPEDSHYAGLQRLIDECANAFPQHQLFVLPLPEIINAQGIRLPASYANYLICNSAVICPVYQQPEDKHALQILALAYPDHTIVPVNCLPLVQQYGSLHCVTMQIPRDTLSNQINPLLKKGIVDYVSECEQQT